jgi:hypothetical protein
MTTSSQLDIRGVVLWACRMTLILKCLVLVWSGGQLSHTSCVLVVWLAWNPRRSTRFKTESHQYSKTEWLSHMHKRTHLVNTKLHVLNDKYTCCIATTLDRRLLPIFGFELQLSCQACRGTERWLRLSTTVLLAKEISLRAWSSAFYNAFLIVHDG